MVNQFLVTTLNKILGTGRSTSRGNYAYDCPFCKRKGKFEIQLEVNKTGKNPWHCWVCNSKGNYLGSLLKKIDTPREIYSQIKSQLKNQNIFLLEKEETSTPILEFPKEFKSLQKVSKYDILGRHALVYLKNRGITQQDIIKYNIGYCETGKYANRIIFPILDNNFNTIYFSGRLIENENTSGKKYKNPPVSRDIIANEHLINWDLPIILCEGILDAISIKRNAIPLLGKNIQKQLLKKLATSKTQKIYIALDKDAIKQSLKYCEYLLNENKEVYLVDLQEKDPNQIGFKNFTKLIQQTQPIDYHGLLLKKLEI